MRFWIWRGQRTWGAVALGTWLIATGALALSGIVVPHSPQILALLALVAGVLILLQR